MSDAIPPRSSWFADLASHMTWCALDSRAGAALSGSVARMAWLRCAGGRGLPRRACHLHRCASRAYHAALGQRAGSSQVPFFLPSALHVQASYLRENLTFFTSSALTSTLFVVEIDCWLWGEPCRFDAAFHVVCRQRFTRDTGPRPGCGPFRVRGRPLQTLILTTLDPRRFAPPTPIVPRPPPPPTPPPPAFLQTREASSAGGTNTFQDRSRLH